VLKTYSDALLQESVELPRRTRMFLTCLANSLPQPPVKNKMGFFVNRSDHLHTQPQYWETELGPRKGKASQDLCVCDGLAPSDDHQCLSSLCHDARAISHDSPRKSPRSRRHFGHAPRFQSFLTAHNLSRDSIRYSDYVMAR